MARQSCAIERERVQARAHMMTTSADVMLSPTPPAYTG